MTNPKPFVKWVGGKRSLLKQLSPNLPKDFSNYYEPFVGGGAMYYFLLVNNLLENKQVFLSDCNCELLITYKTVRDNLHALLAALRNHAKNHSKEYYYEIRSQHQLQDPIKIAARLLYLNRTCFNGLYRVNSKGNFNVPIGRYKNPNIVQEENLTLVSAALKETTLECQDFRLITASKDDLVYLDPPYHPTSNNFTKYSKKDFSTQDQIDVHDLALKLHALGAFVVISNSDSSFIRNLYSHPPFNIQTVQAPRKVNRNAHQREPVNELLIRNF